MSFFRSPSFQLLILVLSLVLTSLALDQNGAPLVQPLRVDSKSILGSSSAPEGSLVTVFLNDAVLGTTTIHSGGFWRLELDQTLAQSDRVAARVTVNGVSSASSLPVVVEPAASPHELCPALSVDPVEEGSPAIRGKGAADSQVVSVSIGRIPIGSAIVNKDGDWELSGLLPTLLTAGELITATVTLPDRSSCSSVPVPVARGYSSSDTAIAFSGKIVVESAVVGEGIRGRSVPDSSVDVAVNGFQVGKTDALSDGSWSITLPSFLLRNGDTVTATMSVDGVIRDAASPVVAKPASTQAIETSAHSYTITVFPVLSGSTVVSGFYSRVLPPGISCDAEDPSSPSNPDCAPSLLQVTLFRNGLSLGTAIVDTTAMGEWSLSDLTPVSKGDTFVAVLSVSATVSISSHPVTAFTAPPKSAPFSITSSLAAGTTAVSGTGVDSPADSIVKLFVNSHAVSSSPVVDGSWSLLLKAPLAGGDVVTAALILAGEVPSSVAGPITVTGKPIAASLSPVSASPDFSLSPLASGDPSVTGIIGAQSFGSDCKISVFVDARQPAQSEAANVLDGVWLLTLATTLDAGDSVVAILACSGQIIRSSQGVVPQTGNDFLVDLPIHAASVFLSGSSGLDEGQKVKVYLNGVDSGLETSVKADGKWKLDHLLPTLLREGDRICFYLLGNDGELVALITAVVARSCLSSDGKSSLPSQISVDLDSPVCLGSSAISGKSTAPVGSIVTVFLSSIPVASTVVEASGVWIVTQISQQLTSRRGTSVSAVVLTSGSTVSSTPLLLNACLSVRPDGLGTANPHLSSPAVPLSIFPVYEQSTSISGTSSLAPGSTVIVYLNSVMLGRTFVRSDNLWELDGFSAADFVVGDTLTASGILDGQIQDLSGPVVVTPIPLTVASASSKYRVVLLPITLPASAVSAFTTAPHGSASMLFVNSLPTTTATVDDNGAIIFVLPLSASLNPGDIISISVTTNKELVSSDSTVVVSSPPSDSDQHLSVATSTIVSGSSSVSGNCLQCQHVSVFVQNNLRGSATVSSTEGTWTVVLQHGSVLLEGDLISVVGVIPNTTNTAAAQNLIVSGPFSIPYSSGSTIGGQIVEPKSSAITVASVFHGDTSLGGLSSREGCLVTAFVNGLSQSSTKVAHGSWSASLNHPLHAGDSVAVTVHCEGSSSSPNLILHTVAQSSLSPFSFDLPLLEQSTSISGNIFLERTGEVFTEGLHHLKFLLNGLEVNGSSTSAVHGNAWSIAGLHSTLLRNGDVVSVFVTKSAPDGSVSLLALATAKVTRVGQYADDGMFIQIQEPVVAGGCSVTGTTNAPPGSDVTIFAAGVVLGHAEVHDDNSWGISTLGPSIVSEGMQLLARVTVFQGVSVSSLPVVAVSNNTSSASSVTLSGSVKFAALAVSVDHSQVGALAITGKSSASAGSRVSVYVNAIPIGTTTVLDSHVWALQLGGSSVLKIGSVISAILTTEGRTYLSNSILVEPRSGTQHGLVITHLPVRETHREVRGQSSAQPGSVVHVFVNSGPVAITKVQRDSTWSAPIPAAFLPLVKGEKITTSVTDVDLGIGTAASTSLVGDSDTTGCTPSTCTLVLNEALVGATVISGRAQAPAGTVITVYRNFVMFGGSLVGDDGGWSLELALDEILIAGDTLLATTTVSFSNTVVVGIDEPLVSLICNTTIFDTPSAVVHSDSGEIEKKDTPASTVPSSDSAKPASDDDDDGLSADKKLRLSSSSTKSATPLLVIIYSVSVGNTVVSGTCNAPDDSAIMVFLDGGALATTSVHAGAWIVSDLPTSLLQRGARLTATVTFGGEVIGKSNQVIVGQQSHAVSVSQKDAKCNLHLSLVTTATDSVSGIWSPLSLPSSASSHNDDEASSSVRILSVMIYLNGLPAVSRKIQSTTGEVSWSASVQGHSLSVGDRVSAAVFGGESPIALCSTSESIVMEIMDDSAHSPDNLTESIAVAQPVENSLRISGTSSLQSGAVVSVYKNSRIVGSAGVTRDGTWALNSLTEPLQKDDLIAASVLTFISRPVRVVGPSEDTSSIFINIFKPVVAGIGSVHGSTNAPVASSVSVLVNDKLIGSTKVRTGGTWALNGILRSVLLVGDRVRVWVAGVPSDLVVAVPLELPEGTNALILPPIIAGDTSVHGTASAPPGSTVAILVNQKPIGTALVRNDGDARASGGSWALTGLPSLTLREGDSVVAVVGSFVSDPVVVLDRAGKSVSTQIYTPVRAGSDSLFGITRGAPPASTVTIFVDGTSLLGSTTVFADGSFVLSNISPSALVHGSKVTASVLGVTSSVVVVACRSPASTSSSDSGIISIFPAGAGDSTVHGRAPSAREGDSVDVRLNDILLGTAFISPRNGGEWVLAGLGPSVLSSGDKINATVRLASRDDSTSSAFVSTVSIVDASVTSSSSPTASTSASVQAITVLPVKTGDVEIAGVSSATPGSVVAVLVNDNTAGTTIVTVGGRWVLDGLLPTALKVGDKVSATVTESGVTSPRSSIVEVRAKSGVCSATVSVDPIALRSTQITGKTDAAQGTIVAVFLNGAVLGTAKVSRAGGEWSIAGLLDTLLSQGDRVHATVTVGGDRCASAEIAVSAPVASTGETGITKLMSIAIDPQVTTLSPSLSGSYSSGSTGKSRITIFVNSLLLSTITATSNIGSWSVRIAEGLLCNGDSVSASLSSASSRILLAAATPILVSGPPCSPKIKLQISSPVVVGSDAISGIVQIPPSANRGTTLEKGLVSIFLNHHAIGSADLVLQSLSSTSAGRFSFPIGGGLLAADDVLSATLALQGVPTALSTPVSVAAVGDQGSDPSEQHQRASLSMFPISAGDKIIAGVSTSVVIGSLIAVRNNGNSIGTTVVDADGSWKLDNIPISLFRDGDRVTAEAIGLDGKDHLASSEPMLVKHSTDLSSQPDLALFPVSLSDVVIGGVAINAEANSIVQIFQSGVDVGRASVSDIDGTFELSLSQPAGVSDQFSAILISGGAHSATATTNVVSDINGGEGMATVVTLDTPVSGQTSLSGTCSIHRGATVTVFVSGVPASTAPVHPDGFWQVTSLAPIRSGETVYVSVTSQDGKSAETVPIVVAVGAGPDPSSPQKSDVFVRVFKVAAGDTKVSGSTSAPVNSIVMIFLNGSPAGTGIVSSSGSWSITDFPISIFREGDSLAATVTVDPKSVHAVAISTTILVGTQSSEIKDQELSAKLHRPVDSGKVTIQPLMPGDTVVSGTCMVSSTGNSIVILVNGNRRAVASVVTGGSWSASLSTPLRAGNSVQVAVENVSGKTTFTATTVVSGVTYSTSPSSSSSYKFAMVQLVIAATGAGDTVVVGATTGPPGSLIRLYIDSKEIGTTSVLPDGAWSVKVPAPLVEGAIVVATISVRGVPSGVSAPSRVGKPETSKVQITYAPHILSPITDGTTMVSGTSGEVLGTVIRVLRSSGSGSPRISVGNTAVTAGGIWAVTGISPLKTGEIIVATATDEAGKRRESAFSSPVVVRPSPPVVHGPIHVGESSISGTATAPVGSTVRILVNDRSLGTATVATDGTWSLGSISTSRLIKGQSVTATVTFDSVTSARSLPSQVQNVITPVAHVPIVLGPLFDGCTTVNGFIPALSSLDPVSSHGSKIDLYVDFVKVATVSAIQQGQWHVTGLSPIRAGSKVTASPAGLPDHSEEIVVLPLAAVVSYPIYQNSKRISGFCNEGAGTKIVIQINSEEVSTASVTTDGSWQAFLGDTEIRVGDVVTASVQLGELVSPLSNSVSVSIRPATQSSESSDICSAPVVAVSIVSGFTAVIGTSREPQGTVIRVYLDGQSIGTCTVSAEGTWHLPLSSALEAGDTLTATAADVSGTRNPSLPSAAVIVAPSSPTVLGPLFDSSVFIQGASREAVSTEITVFVNGDAIGMSRVEHGSRWSLEVSPSKKLHTDDVVTAVAIVLSSEGDRISSEQSDPILVTSTDARFAKEAPVLEMSRPLDSLSTLAQGTCSYCLPGATVNLLIDNQVVGLSTLSSPSRWIIEVPKSKLVIGASVVAVVFGSTPPSVLLGGPEVVKPASPSVFSPIEASSTVVRGSSPVPNDRSDAGVVSLLVNGAVVGSSPVNPRTGLWSVIVAPSLLRAGESKVSATVLISGITSLSSSPPIVVVAASTSSVLASQQSAVAEAKALLSVSVSVEREIYAGSVVVNGKTDAPRASEVSVLVNGVTVGTCFSTESGAWSYNGLDSHLLRAGVSVTASVAINQAIYGPSRPVVVAEVASVLHPITVTPPQVGDVAISGSAVESAVGALTIVFLGQKEVGESEVSAEGFWRVTLPSSYGSLRGGEEIFAVLRLSGVTAVISPVSTVGNVVDSSVSESSAVPVWVLGSVGQSDSHISGNSRGLSEGTPIVVFVNDVVAGTTSVSRDGSWTLNNLLPSLLRAGDRVSAATQATKTPSSSYVIVSSSSSSRPVGEIRVDPLSPGATQISGTCSSSEDGVITIFVDTVPVGSAAVTSGLHWTVSISTGLKVGDSVGVVLQLAGAVVDCQNFFIGTSSSGSTIQQMNQLAINQLSAHDTRISGTASAPVPIGATIVVYLGGAPVGTALLSSAGSWSLGGLPPTLLNQGDQVSASITVGDHTSNANIVIVAAEKSQLDSGSSHASSSATRVSILPVAARDTSISGTSDAPVGFSLVVFVNDQPIGSSRIQSDGSWILSEISPSVIKHRDAVRATVVWGREISGSSMVVFARASSDDKLDPNSHVIVTVSPLRSSDVEIRGTSTAPLGTPVTVFVNNVPVGDSSVNEDWTWSLTLNKDSKVLLKSGNEIRASVTVQKTVFDSENTVLVDERADLTLAPVSENSTAISGHTSASLGSVVVLEMNGAPLGSTVVGPDGGFEFAASGPLGADVDDDFSASVGVFSPGSVLHASLNSSEIATTIVVSGLSVRNLPLSENPHDSSSSASKLLLEEAGSISISPAYAGDMSVSGSCDFVGIGNRDATVKVFVKGIPSADLALVGRDGSWSLVLSSNPLADSDQITASLIVDGQTRSSQTVLTSLHPSFSPQNSERGIISVAGPLIAGSTAVSGFTSFTPTTAIPEAHIILFVNCAEAGRAILDQNSTSSWVIRSVTASTLKPGDSVHAMLISSQGGSLLGFSATLVVGAPSSALTSSNGPLLSTPSRVSLLPLSAGASIISGDSSAEPGAPIIVFVGGMAVGKTVVRPDGTWALSDVHSLLLRPGDRCQALLDDDASSSSELSNTVVVSSSLHVSNAASFAANNKHSVSIAAVTVGDTQISGTSTAPEGSSVTVFKDGLPIGTGTTRSDGEWRIDGVTVSAGSVISASVTPAGSSPTGISDALVVTEPLDLNSSGNLRAPVLSEPVIAGATIIMGTSEQPHGSTITLYLNGAPIKQSFVLSGGLWTVSPIPASLLKSGDKVSGAVTVGKQTSFPSVPIVVIPVGSGSDNNSTDYSPSSSSVRLTLTPPISGASSLGGTVSNPPVGDLTLKIYASGVLVAMSRCSGTIWTTSLPKGSEARAGDVISVVLVSSSAEILDVTSGNVADVHATSDPSKSVVIIDTPLFSGAIRVSGSSPSSLQGSTITIFVNGVPLGTVTIAESGKWVLSGLSAFALRADDSVVATVSQNARILGSSVSVKVITPNSASTTGSSVTLDSSTLVQTASSISNGATGQAVGAIASTPKPQQQAQSVSSSVSAKIVGQQPLFGVGCTTMPPVIKGPLVSGATSIKGTTTAAIGSKITLTVDTKVVGETRVIQPSTWAVTCPPLKSGQKVVASVVAVTCSQKTPVDSVPVFVTASLSSKSSFSSTSAGVKTTTTIVTSKYSSSSAAASSSSSAKSGSSSSSGSSGSGSGGGGGGGGGVAGDTCPSSCSNTAVLSLLAAPTSIDAGTPWTATVATVDGCGSITQSTLASHTVISKIGVSSDVVSSQTSNGGNLAIALTASGLYRISVTVGGRQVKGSPATVQVVAGSVDVNQTVLSGSLIQGAGAPVGQVLDLTVYLRDRLGNRLTSGGSRVAATIGRTGYRSVSLRDNGDGSYSLTHTSQSVGKLSVGIFVQGVAVANSPFLVDITTVDVLGDLDLSQSFVEPLSFDSSTSIQAASLISFTYRPVSSKNFFLPFGCCGDPIIVTVQPEGTSLSVKQGEDGRFVVFGPAPATKGVHAIHITSASGTLISKIPFFVAASSPSAAQSYLTLSESSPLAGEPFELSLIAVDASGNRNDSALESAVFSIVGPLPSADSVSLLGTPTFEGIYKSEARLAAAGDYLVTAALSHSGQLASIPIRVASGGISPVTSSLTLADSRGRTLSVDSPLQGQVGTALVLLFRAFDAHGNSISFDASNTSRQVESFTQNADNGERLDLLCSVTYKGGFAFISVIPTAAGSIFVTVTEVGSNVFISSNSIDIADTSSGDLYLYGTSVADAILDSAVLSDTGSMITVNLALPVADGIVRRGLWDCSLVFSGSTTVSLGTGALCAWKNRFTFTVLLGSGAIILPGDALYFLGAPGAAGPLSPPVNPSCITAVISAPQRIGGSASLTLDASQSVGGSGRPLIFEWSLVSGPQGIASEVVKQALADAHGQTSLTLSKQSLISGATYTFGVLVTDWMDSSSFTTTNVTKISADVPTIIVPPLTLALPGEEVIINAQISCESCAVGSELLASWRQVDGPALDFSAFRANALSQASLVVPAGLLQAGYTYTFSLTSTSSDPALRSSWAVSRVVVNYRHLSVSAVGGDSRDGLCTSEKISLSSIIDASASFSSSSRTRDLQFQWRCQGACFSSPYVASLLSKDLMSQSLILPSNALLAGDSTFTVTVLEPKTGRSVSATQVLSVSDCPPSTCRPSVSLTAPHSSTFSAASSCYAFQASMATLCCQKGVSWGWSIQAGDASLSDIRAVTDHLRRTSRSTSQPRENGIKLPQELRATGVQSDKDSDQVFMISSDYLTPGVSYTLRFSASCAGDDSSTASWADATITAPIPPHAGSFSVSSPTGVALQTYFQLTGQGWIDELDGVPSLYEYFLAVPDASDEIPLGSSIHGSVTTVLPELSSGSKIVLYVYSRTGARTRVSVPITVAAGEIESLSDSVSFALSSNGTERFNAVAVALHLNRLLTDGSPVDVSLVQQSINTLAGFPNIDSALASAIVDLARSQPSLLSSLSADTSSLVNEMASRLESKRRSCSL